MKHLLVLVALLSACAHAPIPPAPLRAPAYIVKRARDLVEPNLAGACRRYQAGFTDRETMLACGKWMFFYETFDTAGVPSSLPRLLVRVFVEELGHGFAKLGLIPDPSSKDHLPFGMASGKMLGMATSIAFTCASCHVARLPDGRLAIGAPNHDYDYGRHILALTAFPFMATGGTKGHAANASVSMQPLLEHLDRQPQIWAKLGGALMLAIGAFKYPNLGPEIERAYASWPPGAQDFVLAPLAVDDQVEVVSKIPPLYGMPRQEEIERATMPHALLGWTGNAHSLYSFMRGFISLGGGDPDKWPEPRMRPLLEYLYSLEAPRNPDPAPPAQVAAGRALFQDKGCAECHDGPGYGGRRLFKIEEVGTDDAITKWLDPKLEGQPCCKARIDDPLTHMVKAPRLIALWLQKRFLHNGALSSLEQLFCLEPRPSTPAPLSTAGHRQTCDGLDKGEKRSLIAFLLSL